MMIRPLFVAAATILLTMSTPAFGAPKKGDAAIPPPGSTSEAAVKTWIKRYIDDDDLSLMTSDEESAEFVQISSFAAEPNKPVRYWVRGEAFAPVQVDEGTYLSSMMLLEADCTGNRYRLLAMDLYSASNLQGDVVFEADDGEAEWRFPRPGTRMWGYQVYICEFARGYIETKSKVAETLGVWKPVEGAR